MQTKVEVLEGLLRKLTVEVPAEEVHAKVTAQLEKLQKTARVDGFRPGKVPAHVIQKKYGESILRDAIDASIQSTYSEALKAENIEPAGEPSNIQVNSGLAANENLIYEVQVEVMPEIELKGLDTLSIEKPKAEIVDADVEDMVETLRKQAGTWNVADVEQTENGHQVVVSFVGKMNGEAFDGGSAEKVPVVIGEGRMLPDFENALLGRKSGEEFSSDVKFPEDYQVEDLAGKTATFEFKIEEIKALELPTVDEEFIKQFGIKDSSVDGFRKSIRENLERQLRQVVRAKIHMQVKQHLIDSNDFLIPEVMVRNEKLHIAKTENLEERVKDEAARTEIIENQFDAPARQRVSLGLIMSELFTSLDVKPDQDKIDAYIDDVASTYEDPEAFKTHYKKDANFMQEVMSNVLEDQLIDSLVEKAEIKEVESSFKDLMKASA